MTLDELMAELRPQVEATMRSHGARETRIDAEAAERRRLRHALAAGIVRVGMWVDGRGHERVLTAESNQADGGHRMQDFKDKVAVVTGAASGIGRGLANHFAAEGMRVVLADVEQPALDEAARELSVAGASVLAVKTDVAKLADVEALAATTLERFGGVHVLCNNAGVGGGGLSIWESPLEDWQWTLGVNLWGVIHGVRTFAPIMIERGEEGHIVNTASVAGLIAGAGGPAYTVSKFGVVGLSEVLYHEMHAASGGKIGVSVLCPALTNTRIIESGRNHPSGPRPEPAPGTPERMGLDMLREIFKGGMDPAETASIVGEAIRERRFYVVTHPEHNPRLEARAEAIVSGGAPPLLMPMPVAP